MRQIHHRPIYPVRNGVSNGVYARFHALVALGFLFGVVYGAFSLTLPILADKIFANIALLGLVFALPELFGIFLDIPLGAFAARFGRRHTIFYSGAILAISAFVFIKFPNPFLFLLTLIFYELATQAFIIPADAELMALTPPRRTGRFHGIAEGFHNFGYAVGPILAGWLLVWNIPSALWLAFAGSIGMILLSAIFLPKESKTEPFPQSISDVWRRDRVYLSGLKEFRKLGFLGSYLAFLFFILAVHWGFTALLEPLYTTKLGFDEKYIGLIFAGFTLPFLLVSFVAGKFIDRGGGKTVAISGLLLMAISMIGFGTSTQPLIFFMFSLVHGIGAALLLTSVMSVIDLLSSYHPKERISGVVVFAESTGYFVGPLLAGFAVTALDFSPTFVVLGLFTLAFAIITKFVSFDFNAETRKVF